MSAAEYACSCGHTFAAPADERIWAIEGEFLALAECPRCSSTRSRDLRTAPTERPRTAEVA